MDNRIWVAALALAISTPQCKSATPAPVETAGELTPAALFHPPAETPGAEPAEPVTEPIMPEPGGDEMLYELEEDEKLHCPLALSGVTLTAEEAPNGIMLVFSTDGDDDRTDRVREAAKLFYEDLTRTPKSELPVPSLRTELSFSEAPGGAVIVFVPENLDQLESLRDEVRGGEQRMQEARACPSRLPASIELVP